MTKRYQKLTSASIKKLKIGEKITERGITAVCTKDGDIKYEVGVSVDGQRIHRVIGSKADGTAFFPWEKGDHTCSNWTSSADDGKASLGHHDRHGGGNTSWNAAHHSRGCSQAKLAGSGGAGLIYCFAAD